MTVAASPTRGRRTDVRATGEEGVSDSIAAGSARDLPATLAAAIGCVCSTDATLDTVVAKLIEADISKDRLHLGALDPARAQAAAQRLGIAAGVSSEDPLGSLTGPGGDASSREAMDRGGMLGGVIGAIVGCAIGLTPAAAIVAAPHDMALLANIALYFALGAIVGSVLGAALAPQPSTHTGFRLIDGMQEGGYALIVIAPSEQHAQLRRLFEGAGAAGITSV